MITQDKDEGFREGAKCVLNPNNPIFSRDKQSAKLTAVLKVLEKNEKAIIRLYFIGENIILKL